MLTIVVADNSVLMREGFKALVPVKHKTRLSEASDKEGLFSALKKNKPQLLVMDPLGLQISPADIILIKSQYPKLAILAISNMMLREEISLLLNAGVTSFLLKECDEQEICDAIENSLKGIRFLCGQIVNTLIEEKSGLPVRFSGKKVTCEGFTISEREIEIIKHIALGFSNKQIADKLFLSFHTVHTHRKNIMQKLNVNNTAGVVMFAVKNNLLANQEIHAN